MLDRRYAIVAGLGIVELWIVGLALRSVAGSGGRAAEAVAAVPDASAAGSQGTFAAGAVPLVIIDDATAAVTVTVRPGTDVTVDDRSASSACGIGRPDVRVGRTAAGLTISRRNFGRVYAGWCTDRLAVTVPPGAQLDVRDAASIRVAGLRADATLHSDAGRIVVSDHRGALRVRTDVGSIELSDIQAPSVDAAADVGRIELDRVRAGRVTLAADAGRITVERSILGGGSVRADSGAIALSLEPQSNVTVAARTADGRITAPAGANDATDDTARTVRLGDGSGRLDVNTDRGAISIQMVGV